MKTILFSRASAMLAVLALVVAFGCSNQELAPAKNSAIPAEILANFEELGFDVSDIAKVPHHHPVSEEYLGDRYLLEGDILISEDQMNEMLSSGVDHLGALGEQYRTTNLVTGTPRVINIVGYNKKKNALTNNMKTALQMAVDNYNDLNIGLTFNLTFSTNTAGADITVYKVGGPAGGSAGFPTGGNPYDQVLLNSGLKNYSVDVIEHVITHEIGHCLGLRHTDYFNRSLSCGTGGNEGDAGIGAIHIPGTPTGFDPTSIMLSCFNSSVTGEFGQYDVVALEHLY
ncbi:M57 family metalloprotease [Pontibacter sp. G13]|uniref:M57 family metalloprotease n=1 Tax=Pontibacter sp. G13 TaxID=3074898 RepID=UPI00288A4889|nr:M57 family metalloprotease [Pontibacter sp. G13]WNJ20670.1 M57 family metalloprotease [Pontibacter sp. G13]